MMTLQPVSASMRAAQPPSAMPQSTVTINWAWCAFTASRLLSDRP